MNNREQVCFYYKQWFLGFRGWQKYLEKQVGTEKKIFFWFSVQTDISEAALDFSLREKFFFCDFFEEN